MARRPSAPRAGKGFSDAAWWAIFTTRRPSIGTAKANVMEPVVRLAGNSGLAVVGHVGILVVSVDVVRVINA